MKIIALAVLILYSLALLIIFLYSMVQLHLLINALKKKKDTQGNPAGQKPVVTIQLPVFNEKYVIERLVHACMNIDYPKEKFEVQILDDSTDETTQIAQKLVHDYEKEGYHINLIRRANREGFKAGALQYGLSKAKGEFIAIFDADFIPDKEFLTKTLAAFRDDIGMVQTRWVHINRNYSLLTMAQAMGLDVHFSIEQAGRNAGNYFMNFNGTAGIWRKKCIEDAGGWQHDTLTEDLDLSFRAQMKGWHFKYLDEVHSPAELPSFVSNIRTQQYRWTKGAAETAIKIWPLLRKKQFSLGIKLHALSQLFSGLVFMAVFICAILSVPAVWIKSLGYYESWFEIAGIFLFSLVVVSLIYLVAFEKQKSNYGLKTWNFGWLYPLFLSYSMGMALHNSLAAMHGYRRIKTPFIRTPKFNLKGKQGSWKKKAYLETDIEPVQIIEMFLCLYFLAALSLDLLKNDIGIIPFHLMLFFGFGLLSLSTFKHQILNKP